MSVKKFIVDLTDQERDVCREVVRKLKGTSQKVKRANILLKADAGWTDAKIAEALDCRTKTVENVRKRLVERGFEQTLNGRVREKPPVEKLSTANRRPESSHCVWVSCPRALASGR